jgi:hypothetical protein
MKPIAIIFFTITFSMIIILGIRHVIADREAPRSHPLACQIWGAWDILC